MNSLTCSGPIPMSSWLTKYETKSNCFWKCGVQILDEESRTNTMSAGFPEHCNFGLTERFKEKFSY